MPEKMKKPSAVWSVTMFRIGFVTHFLSLLGKYKQILILSKYKWASTNKIKKPPAVAEVWRCPSLQSRCLPAFESFSSNQESKIKIFFGDLSRNPLALSKQILPQLWSARLCGGSGQRCAGGPG